MSRWRSCVKPRNGHETKTSYKKSMSNSIQFKEDSLFDDEEISLFNLSDTVFSACLGCAGSYRKSRKSRVCRAETSSTGNIWSRNCCFFAWSVMNCVGLCLKYSLIITHFSSMTGNCPGGAPGMRCLSAGCTEPDYHCTLVSTVLVKLMSFACRIWSM
jgi:hypothetical protein